MNHEYTGIRLDDGRLVVLVLPHPCRGLVTRLADAWEYACLDALQDGMRAVSS